jgi:type IV fimbrial biogenesis protein FimT
VKEKAAYGRPFHLSGDGPRQFETRVAFFWRRAPAESFEQDWLLTMPAMKLFPSPRLDDGFTIFELVVVMGIVAIIAIIGVPSYKYVTTANRIATEVNAMLADMRYARTEAVRQGLPVVICSSNDQQTCAANNNAWESGWIIFADPNNTLTPASVGAILRVQMPFATAYASTDTFDADNAFAAITFNREGFGSNHIATPTNTVTMSLHSTPLNSQWSRCLVITPIGGVSIQRVGSTVGNCAT